jgi:hypothetical protein
MGPTERLALSWGKARQFTKLLLSLLSHVGGKWFAEQVGTVRLRRPRRAKAAQREA